MDSNQSNTGLLRFLSAPTSLLDYGGGGGGLVGSTKPGSESERLLFSRFCDQSEPPAPENSFDDKSAVAMNNSNPSQQQQHKYGSGYLPPHYPRQSLSSAENGSFMAMEAQSQVKSLSRQSSSPAGLFSHISIPNNGYSSSTTMKGDGSFGEVSPSSNRLKTQISFSSSPSRFPSSLGMLSQISEAGHQSLGAGGIEQEKLGNGNGDARYYGSGYPYSSWNEPSNFAENFGGLRRDQDSNRKLGSSIQNEELGNRIHLLSHHLSLPKNSVEVEKFLHFQDSVPCKVRAKRGCATHPRSIAERVRRTRISERMRKLQELVPNMDKQTNTADMLDLAVDYIKELQKQFKSLSDKRASCKCINTQKPISNQVG